MLVRADQFGDLFGLVQESCGLRGGAPVLLLVASDCDALCACRILTVFHVFSPSLSLSHTHTQKHATHMHTHTHTHSNALGYMCVCVCMCVCFSISVPVFSCCVCVCVLFCPFERSNQHALWSHCVAVWICGTMHDHDGDNEDDDVDETPHLERVMMGITTIVTMMLMMTMMTALIFPCTCVLMCLLACPQSLFRFKSILYEIVPVSSYQSVAQVGRERIFGAEVVMVPVLCPLTQAQSNTCVHKYAHARSHTHTHTHKHTHTYSQSQYSRTIHTHKLSPSVVCSTPSTLARECPSS